MSFLKNLTLKSVVFPAVKLNNFIEWARMGALLLTIGLPGRKVSLKSL